MSTRGSLQRGNTQQSFDGLVHRWKRKLVTVEEKPSVIKRNRLSLLKWVKTDEKGKINDKNNEKKYIPYEKKYHPELSQKNTKSILNKEKIMTIKEETEADILPENLTIKEEVDNVSSVDKIKEETLNNTIKDEAN